MSMVKVEGHAATGDIDGAAATVDESDGRAMIMDVTLAVTRGYRRINFKRHRSSS